MKSIVLISELNFDGCMMCAALTQALWDEYEVDTAFHCENNISSIVCEIGDFDFIVLVGYSEKILNKKILYNLKDKLVLLTYLKDEIIRPRFIREKLSKDNAGFDDTARTLINTIMFTINGATQETENVSSDENIEEAVLGDNAVADFNTEEIEIISDSLADLTDKIACLIERYECGLKVIDNIYSEEERIEFHKYFFAELLGNKEAPWINKFLMEYEKMARDTEELITYVRLYGNSAYVFAKHQRFFEEDIIDFAEVKGYPSVVIEYIQEDGNHAIIYAETTSETVDSFPGNLQDNWNRTIVPKMN